MPTMRGDCVIVRCGMIVVLGLCLAGCSAYRGPIDNKPDPDRANPSRWGKALPLQRDPPASAAA